MFTRFVAPRAALSTAAGCYTGACTNFYTRCASTLTPALVKALKEFEASLPPQPLVVARKKKAHTAAQLTAAADAIVTGITATTPAPRAKKAAAAKKSKKPVKRVRKVVATPAAAPAAPPQTAAKKTASMKANKTEKVARRKIAAVAAAPIVVASTSNSAGVAPVIAARPYSNVGASVIVIAPEYGAILLDEMVDAPYTTSLGRVVLTMGTTCSDTGARLAPGMLVTVDLVVNPVHMQLSNSPQLMATNIRSRQVAAAPASV